LARSKSSGFGAPNRYLAGRKLEGTSGALGSGVALALSTPPFDSRFFRESFFVRTDLVCPIAAPSSFAGVPLRSGVPVVPTAAATEIAPAAGAGMGTGLLWFVLLGFKGDGTLGAWSSSNGRFWGSDEMGVAVYGVVSRFGVAVGSGSVSIFKNVKRKIKQLLRK
jgi:hypothetical protein